jgi:hypothetical protein
MRPRPYLSGDQRFARVALYTVGGLALLGVGGGAVRGWPAAVVVGCVAFTVLPTAALHRQASYEIERDRQDAPEQRSDWGP